MPLSETRRQEDKISILETPKMPLLEATQMPCLEKITCTHSKMPPLENLDVSSDEMPQLEKVMSPVIPASVTLKKLEDMPNLEEIGPSQHGNGDTDQKENIPVQLNVANFPYGTSEKELRALLGQFGAQRITIINNDKPLRSTYAFADFAGVSQAVDAMDNLDQSFLKGRRLVVTLTNPGTALQQQNEAQKSNSTCIDKKIPKLSAFSSCHVGENSNEGSLGPNHGNFNYQRLTTTLHDYTKISIKLRAEDLIEKVTDMTLRVMITHIENERFFWAQILNDSVNGTNKGVQHLETLAREMQRGQRMEPIGGLGRCMAKYENVWYRAWCTFITERNGQEFGDLLFIDYGNRAFARKTEMIRTTPNLWSLPPMAKPFRLVDSKHNLDKYLNQVVTIEVVEPGNHWRNSLTTVRACWM